MGGSLRAHFALFVVEFAHLLIKRTASFLDGFHVHHIVAVSTNCFNMGYHRLDLFITQHSPNSATPRLFEADFLALDVVKTEIQHSDKRMFRSSAG